MMRNKGFTYVLVAQKVRALQQFPSKYTIKVKAADYNVFNFLLFQLFIKVQCFVLVFPRKQS